MTDYILLADLLVNGCPFHKGSIVKVVTTEGDKAIVTSPSCGPFSVDMVHLVKMPETPIERPKRKVKHKILFHK